MCMFMCVFFMLCYVMCMLHFYFCVSLLLFCVYLLLRLCLISFVYLLIYHLLRIFGSKAFVYDTQRDTSNLTARALQGIFCGFAKNMITEVSWAYRIYIPAQHRFIHSGYVQFVETVGRSPEQVLSPIILADLESTVFNVDEWNKALKKTIHFDHEDCTYYVTTRVREYQGLAVVDRLPWPTTKNQRPQTVHLRDVLRMQKISSDQSSGLQIEEIKDDEGTLM